jgi:dTDP-4-dehydrorhamnose reductase
MKILVLGITGMLGNAVFRFLCERGEHEIWGTMRRHAISDARLPDVPWRHILAGVDTETENDLVRVFATVRPNVVINCIGHVKQLAAANDPVEVIPINALLPHRLSLLCQATDARLIQISTDCVFSGKKGQYKEEDEADATDLYGKSKFLGEVAGAHTVTLRTSIVGHELHTTHGLIEWFLAQKGPVKGYTNAYFSGVPTVELATILADHVIPNSAISGLYHVSAERISKYDLLKQVAIVYGRIGDIVPDDALRIDRSLNSERFYNATGYAAPDWAELIKKMHRFR